MQESLALAKTCGRLAPFLGFAIQIPKVGGRIIRCCGFSTGRSGYMGLVLLVVIWLITFISAYFFIAKTWWLPAGASAAAAALEVPTAGVPTNFAASPSPAADVFAASGFGLAVFDSGAAMQYLLNTQWSKLCGGGEPCRRFPPLNISPNAVRCFAKA
jgi:hypothetical protein